MKTAAILLAVAAMTPTPFVAPCDKDGQCLVSKEALQRLLDAHNQHVEAIELLRANLKDCRVQRHV